MTMEAGPTPMDRDPPMTPLSDENRRLIEAVHGKPLDRAAIVHTMSPHFLNRLLNAARAEARSSGEWSGEIVAWSYELATYIWPDGMYGGWEPGLSRDKPNVPAGSIRNLTPLSASPVPPLGKPTE